MVPLRARLPAGREPIARCIVDFDNFSSYGHSTAISADAYSLPTHQRGPSGILFQYIYNNKMCCFNY